MDPERWARVKELFHAAHERDPAQREQFLRDACAGDDALRETVAAMLARQPEAVDFLESPAPLAEAMALARHPGEAAPVGSEFATAPFPRLDTPPRRPRRSRAPWWMYLVAVAFVATFLLRSFCITFGPEDFGYRMREGGGRYVVTHVTPGGLAEAAGMKPGDVVLARDGVPIGRVADVRVTYPNLEVGRSYGFDLERDGRPVSITIVMRRRQVADRWVLKVDALWQAVATLMLAMALLISFKRPRNAVAGMGALTLATLSIGMSLFHYPAGYAALWRSLPAVLGALLWLPNFCISFIGPIGLTFFVLFPRALLRSRWPWVLIWLPALGLLPVDVQSTFLIVYDPDAAYGRLAPLWINAVRTALFGMYGLAMLGAITASYLRLTEVNEKRRLRVLIVGGAAGTLPALLRLLVMGVAPRSELSRFLLHDWPDVAITAAFLLFPLSFAYAILRHRVLGIRVIVRRGMQYALARGSVISLVPAIGLALAVDALVHGDQPLIDVLRARGWVYAALAAVAVLVHTQRRRWSDAIDRRFFREHYDAGHLLRDVTEQARRGRSLEGAAAAVVARLEAVLHPEFAAILFRPTGGAAFECTASSPSGRAPSAISAGSPVVAHLRATEKALQVIERRSSRLEEPLEDSAVDQLHRAGVGLLVPVGMSLDGHEALLAFGAKRSEQPYTEEDLDALEAIASSLALLLDRATPEPDRLSSAFDECPECGACYDTGTPACSRDDTRLTPVSMPRILAGRYRLEHRLGRGGMAKVYEAADSALGRQVAVKVIRDEWVHRAEAARRFRREVQAVAGFAHPNVVTVYDYGVEAGARAFLVMERLHGVTLRDELRRTGRLEAGGTVDVFRGVSSGVEAAHHRQIVHRDLKPENIFLARAPGSDSETVKLLDFGVAKALPGSEQAGSSESGAGTETGVLVGTVGYMSPEQLLGERPSVSWDLWALAIIAYEILAGALPFSTSSRTAWRQAVLDGRFTPLAEHLADPPAAWQDFFARALAVDRARRPASAEEFFRRLKHALGPGHPDRLPPPSSGPGVSSSIAKDQVSQARPTSHEQRRLFVGRDRELSELRQTMGRLSDGQGHFRLIGGEPGIGKTRLGEEILLEARQRGLGTLAGRCYEEGADPLVPFVEILTELANRTPAASLREALGDVAPEVARLVPSVSRLLPDLEDPVVRPPELRQRYLFEGLLELWRKLTKDRPYVLLLDDLHWADASSVSLLQHLVNHLASTPPLPLFIVGTYRDVELEMGEPFERALAVLVRARSARRLVLRRWPLESVGEFLGLLGGPDPPGRLVRAIHQRTEGNPFFVEEVFQHLLEDGKLLDDGGGWKADLEIEELDVPEGVRLVIGRRLERLSADTSSILNAAAVVGRRFELRVLESLRVREPEAVLESLEEAEAAKLIQGVDSDREATYSFTHELIRQTLLGKLSLPRRRGLHLEVADALEGVHRAHLHTRAAEIARHLLAAGSAAEREKTIHYLELGGDSAQAAASSAEALLSFEQALSLLEEGDGTDRRADLLRKRGLAHRGLGRWGEMESDLESALILYEQGRHREGAARICRDLAYHLTWTARAEEARKVAERGLQHVGESDSKSRCRLLSAAGLAHSIVGEVAPSVSLSAEAAALARKLDDPRLLAEVLRDHVLVDFQRLHARRIVEAGAHATSLQRSINARWELTNTLGVLMIGHMLRGDLERSERVAREAESLAGRQADVGLQVHLWNRRALHDQARGDLAACSESWHSAVQLLREHKYPVSLHLGLMGLSFSWQGRANEAQEAFEESAAIDDEWKVWAGTKSGCRVLNESYRGGPEVRSLLDAGREHMPKPGVPNPVGSWHWLAASVEALALLGERQGAGVLYPLTLDLAATTARLSFGLGLVEKVAGIAAAAADQWPESERHFARALKLAQDIPHLLEQAEVRRWHAWMLVSRKAPGDEERARTLVRDCLSRYRDLGMPVHQDIVARLS